MKQLRQAGYETFTNGETETNGSKENPLLVPGATIICRQLNYVIDVTPPGKLCGTIRKTILNDISAVFKPGMNAILGPTGSGKTTLLDTLACRIEEKGIDGEVLVNGQKMTKNFNRLTGYVIQDDVVMESLTVRENINFSANLRRSFKSSDEKKCIVNRVIEELGLTSCADSLIGTALERGVSGGERRRTSIGMELIISPSVLFLDEPTTGLDSSTALAIMNSLHDLSMKNTTIVFTIHQPRYSIFKLFDQLTLLSAGHCIYHGPSNEAIPFFGSLGYEIEEHNNPPDFFLDIINSDSSAIRLQRKNSEDCLEKENSDATRNLAERLSAIYRSSKSYQKVLEEMDLVSSVSSIKVDENQNGDRVHLRKEYAVSCIFQFFYVMKRIFLDFCRRPEKIRLKIGLKIFWGVFIGYLYFQLTKSYPMGIENRRGLLAFLILNILFTGAFAVDAFITGRNLLIHECASGYYRVSAYFFAGICAEISTIHVIPLLIWNVIIYYMAGLRSGGFGTFYLTQLMMSLASSSMSMFVGASVDTVVIGQIIANVIAIIMTLTGGIFINLNDTVLLFKILQYVSIPYYTMRALYVNEFRDLTLYMYNGSEIIEILSDAGNEFLESQGISSTSDWDLWNGIVGLAVLSVIFSAAAYVQLRRIKKLK